LLQLNQVHNLWVLLAEAMQECGGLFGTDVAELCSDDFILNRVNPLVADCRDKQVERVGLVF
jgi:hypothetical protein